MKCLQFAASLAAAVLLGSCAGGSADIPLPEHPRPDFQRSEFVNLNGTWNFTFDAVAAEKGEYDRTITVPFPWGSKLSGVENGGDKAWYSRAVTIPRSWKGKRVFLVIGASDWKTDVSMNGTPLGTHCGGYTPFEFEITGLCDFGGTDTITVAVDDTYSKSHLYGKQGYGDARGIWQTPYLEARGDSYISSIRFIPDIDNSKATAEVSVCGEADGVSVKFINGEYPDASSKVADGKAVVEIPMDGQHLWTLDDPYLYEVEVSVEKDGKSVDEVCSYFGQRKISTVKIPGQEYTYVSLNNKPIYLKLCLDQSYNPEGFYTFPSDEFMKNEMLISKNLGLTGNRIHIKTEIPRKLYWADRLGLLIMADIPCYFGPAVDSARMEWEQCMREQVARDFNHPSIFAWVDFNETWGLTEMGNGYTKNVQEWVRSMYLLNKSLDPTRLVEDNSACHLDHVQTDINSWHSYLPNYLWEATDSLFDANTWPGSGYNYTEGNFQGNEPMINSECGNVWGYREGSAGDSDYSWDYHEMMNAFRRHPKIAGWLYTEHHDVINEWNGYVRYDRSAKVDGLCDFVDGMGIADFHSDYYITPASPFYSTVPAGSRQCVKLMSSFTTADNPGEMTLETVFCGYDFFGNRTAYDTVCFPVAFKPFMLAEAACREVSIPEENGIYELSYVLKNEDGRTLHRNFSLFVVNDGKGMDGAITFEPDEFSGASWSQKQTSVSEGRKVDGAGSGWFEYKVEIPQVSDAEHRASHLYFEASSNRLFGKDIDDNMSISGEFHLGEGTFDPCKSPNAYSMTDMVKWPSKVQVSVNGQEIGTYELEDNPADHRGVLSWISQPHNRRMSEAGSYGYLVDAVIPAGALKTGENVIRLAVPESAAGENGGGLAIYGKEFGRYPIGPSIIFE